MYIKIILFSFTSLFLLTSCNSNEKTYNYSQGEVFGTYYRFQIDSDKDYSKQIDSVFIAIDKAVNSYVVYSEISTFNKRGFLLSPSPTFIDMLQKAETYHHLSNGYFDPTLYPLINAWGFGLTNKEKMDSAKVDSLIKLVSFKKLLAIDSTELRVLKKGVTIDLNAMGEGYALDAITSILDQSGVNNYMVEIGGEMKCKGLNQNGNIWQIGIENPTVSIDERGTSLMKVVKLKNVGISTSGNYRKFYTDRSGNRYSHIIDAKTGYPVQHNLLSASIISTSATKADALATACMSMGTEKAKYLIENEPDIEGFLIYSDGNNLKSWQSSRFPE